MCGVVCFILDGVYCLVCYIDYDCGGVVVVGFGDCFVDELFGEVVFVFRCGEDFVDVVVLKVID